MKRCVVFILLLLVASGFIFAGHFAVLGQVSPIASQLILMSDGNHVGFTGVSVNAGIRYLVTKVDMTFGLDVSYGHYSNSELGMQYNVNGIRFVTSYITDIYTPVLFFEARGGVGFDYRYIGKTGGSVLLCVDAYPGIGIRLNSSWVITAGAKLGMAFKLMNLEKLADFELKYQAGLIYVM